MRRLLLMVVGIGMIVAAAALLWMAYGPQSKAERTTGGVLYTQQEAAEGGDLGAVVDATSGQPAIMPQEARIESGALAGSASADAPETTAQLESVPAMPLTTDIVLDDNVQVAVAPLGSASSGIATDGGGGASSVLTGYEQRVVELEWPAKFQVGRSGAVRIKLKVLKDGSLQPVAEVAGNEVLATPILITDRYDTHNATVTATLSAPDFKVAAVSSATQPMTRGGEPEWRWTLRSDSSRTAVIVIGLTLNWEPKSAGAPPAPTNVPIWGQTLQVEVNYVFGLITVPQASTAGTVLAVLGFVMEIPLLGKVLETLWDIVFGRRDRRRDTRSRSRRR